MVNEGSDTVVQLEEVSVGFKVRRGLMSGRSRRILAVDQVSLSVQRGQTLGVVGATGSGKSTIAHVIMGMVQPTSGTVTISGHELAGTKGRERRDLESLRQVVLQDPYSSLDPRMKVRDIIAEPLTVGAGVGKPMSRRATDERVAELLELVGLPAERAGLYPYQFSGGQRQRISIARALAPNPQLIVLDEPTSALDVSVRAQILNLLKSLQERLGVTFVIISHDLVTVAYLASTVAVMHLGRIVEIGPTQSIYHVPRHPFTHELLASSPSLTRSFLDLPRSVPQKPGPDPPGACRFAPKCALRTQLGEPEQCLEEPPLAQFENDHRAACHFSDQVGQVDHYQTTPYEEEKA